MLLLCCSDCTIINDHEQLGTKYVKVPCDCFQSVYYVLLMISSTSPVSIILQLIGCCFLSTVKPLIRATLLGDKNFGPCREFGCFQRLFSITLVPIRLWWVLRVGLLFGGT